MYIIHIIIIHGIKIYENILDYLGDSKEKEKIVKALCKIYCTEKPKLSISHR